jgi:hypothetical protein
MSASLLGTAVGTCIGALLSFGAWSAARKHLQQHPGAIAIYRAPDWVGYARTAAPILGLLVFFHYLPVIAAKLYPLLLGRQLVISGRGYEAVLFLAHAMAFVGLSTGLFGLLWAAFQDQRGRPRSRGPRSGGDA